MKYLSASLSIGNSIYPPLSPMTLLLWVRVKTREGVVFRPPNTIELVMKDLVS